MYDHRIFPMAPPSNAVTRGEGGEPSQERKQTVALVFTVQDAHRLNPEEKVTRNLK